MKECGRTDFFPHATQTLSLLEFLGWVNEELVCRGRAATITIGMGLIPG